MMRQLTEKAVPLWSWLCIVLLGAILLTIIGYLLWQGGPALDLSLLFGDVGIRDALLLRRPVFDGLFPAIAGTVALVLIAVTIAVPIGVAAGIYMAEYAGARTKTVLSLLFDLLASLPSIVIGLAGFSLTIFLHHLFPGRVGPSLGIAALALSFLVLPYLIRTTQLTFESIPPVLRQTAPALGATKLQNIFRVLLPLRSNDILGGIILAIGRTAEDTAVIMLTGVVASAGVPRSLFGQFEALPFYIYYISSQYSDAGELQTGFGAAILLLAICGLLFLLAYLLQQAITRKHLQ